jgi:hypothetical protein
MLHGTTPPRGYLPRDGRIPTTPHISAGIRSDPFVSEPIAQLVSPAATPDADPDEDPAVVYSGFRAFFVTPCGAQYLGGRDDGERRWGVVHNRVGV